MTHPTQSRDALPVRSATERWLPAVAALGAVVLGLLLTFLVWREVREQSDLGAAARFTGTIQDVRTRLDQRLDAYAQILRGATGLVLTRASIDRATWAAYHASLEIPKRFPGVQTFLWVPAVPPGGAAAFEREQRRRGHPDFRIWTRGDAKPVTTIAFVEPFVRENTKALGFDMYSEPVRREAMARARDSGDMAITGRVSLVIDDRPLPGFIMYVPVYHGGGVPVTIEARRERLLGFVSSAFRIEDLLSATLGNRLLDFHVRVFDGPVTDDDRLMFDSAPSGTRAADGHALFRHVISFPVGGRPWAVELTSTPSFDARSAVDHSSMVAVSGVLLTALGAWAVGLALSLRGRTRALSRLTTTLQANQRDLESANAAMAEARDTALAAVRAKSEFLANMSHEIRTPIHGFMGHTELALANPLDDETRRYLETARDCGAALQAVVDDILDFSKLEAGKFELDDTTFDLRDLMLQSMRTVSLRARAKGLALFWSADPALPTLVRGDPKRLRQVLLNLLSNAVKFTASGEVELTAEPVHAATDALQIRFAVRDTGIGMSDDTRAQLFQAFQQADTSITREFGGTGLGLAISDRIVALMGGHIDVTSAPGTGSTFAFVAIITDASVPGTPARPTPRRALLLDDNPRRAEATRKVLLHAGIDAIACRDADDVAARAGDADCAVIDRQACAPEILARLSRTLPTAVTTIGSHAPAVESLGEDWQGIVCPHPLDPAQLVTFLERGSAARDHVPPSTAPAAPPRRLRLLIAEDNPVNRTLIDRMLTRMGHEFVIVEDGAAAVDASAAGGFDAILMDVHMPVMDGREASRRIRARESRIRSARLPILALTADALPGDRERCIEAGMDGHLTKPISAAALREALDELATQRPQAAHPGLSA
jgi:signal transduction histidine kinase/CheY-like chemotaxis protein